jgi:methanethiol S-methyltransferase
VGALAFFAYYYAVVWSHPAPFDARAIAVDACLFVAFGAHHSVFARASIKERLTRIIPSRLIRSVYVWIASLLLILVCVAWQRIGGRLYEVTGWPAALFAALQLSGVAIIAASVRTIDALELAGISQPSVAETLQITGPYRLVRHPIYLGWLLATFGAANLTGDRLAFAIISAIYLVAAIPWEERSLTQTFGPRYTDYQRLVPWRVVPYVY